MPYRFGASPDDRVVNKAGHPTATSFGVYATEADALAQANLLATVSSDEGGSWSYSHPSDPIVWLRLPDNSVYPITSIDAVESVLAFQAPDAVPAATAVTQGFAFQATAGIPSGSATPPWKVPFDGLINTGVELWQDDYHPTVSTIMDIEKRQADGSYSSIFGTNTKPTITAGMTTGTSTAPALQAVVKGDFIRGNLTQAPPGPTGAGTAATHPIAPATYGDGATTKSTTHTVPLPTAAQGATTDDVVLVIIPNAQMGALPAGWTLVNSTSTTPNAKLTINILAAQWSPTLTGTFTVKVTVAAVATSILLRSVDIKNIGQIVFSDGAEATGAGAFSTPSFTTSAACDFLIVFSATYFVPTADGWRQDWTTAGGPTGITKAFDLLTAQGSTILDYGLALGFANGVGSGATVPSQAINLTGGSGALTSTTHMTGVICVKRRPSSHGVSYVRGEIRLEAS